jgi:MFS family permease
MNPLPTASRGAFTASAYAWFLVVVLTLANCVSFIDRLIVSLLVLPIQNELNISDTQFGLLAGAAFAIFYCSMGILIARWADRYSRKWIVTVGITLWCAMTALAGTARSYLELFLYRIGVGVGEATLSPSAYSLLANTFPPQRLALPIGVFSAGVTAGTGLAFLLGGVLIAQVFAAGPIGLPLFGSLSGWRAVMVTVGLLGLPVAFLMLLAREPNRPTGFTPASLASVWQHFQRHHRGYGYVFAGYGTTSVTAFAVMTWTPKLYMQQYAASIATAAATLGTVAMLGGISGALSGGFLADWLERRSVANAKLKVLFACGMGLVLPSIVAPFMPSMLTHAAWIFFTFYFGTAATGPAGAFVQSLTPDNMRAQFGAIYQFALTLVGATLGPFLVGLFNDYLFRDSAALGRSMALVALIANPIAVWLLWRALKAARVPP